MKILTVVGVILIFLQTTALAAPAEALQAKAMVTTMIEHLRGQINVSLHEMTVQRPTWSRTLKIKSWDDRKNKKVFLRILGPARDEGTCFLRLGYNLWSYLPNVEKTMKIPPSMMLQSWMGSDFTNDDLVKESSYIDDYTHQILSEEKKDGKTVLQIELLPKPNAPVVWGKVVFLVWKEESLPLTQSFYDEKGKLIKHMKFTEFKKMDGVLLPTVWEMENIAKGGEKTLLKLLTIDFNPAPPIADWVFTQQHFTKKE